MLMMAATMIDGLVGDVLEQADMILSVQRQLSYCKRDTELLRRQLCKTTKEK